MNIAPNVSESIQGIVSRAMSSEEIESAIESAIIKTVTRAINDHLCSYSDFGKAVEQMVSKALQFEPVDLPSYNDLIVKLVRNAVKSHTEKAIAQQVEKQVHDLFEPPPETLLLSDLIEKYVARIRRNNEGGCVCYGESAAKVVVDSDDEFGSFLRIRLYESENDSREEIYIGVHVRSADGEQRSGTIYHLRFQNRDVENQMFVDELRSFERMLFQMKAAKSTISIDCDPSDLDLDTAPEHH